MILAKTRPSRAAAASLPLHDLSTAGGLPDQPFVAVVPGESVPLIPLDLPGALKGTARERVARRQLRDAYGGGETGLDARPARLGETPEAWQRMLVTEAATRADWARAAAPAGALCRAVLPDYLGLPAAPGLWVIEADAARIRARLGLEDGFAAEPDLALALLQETVETAPPRAILWQGALPPEIAAWLGARGLPVCHDAAALAEHGVDPPRCFSHGELALDLARDPGAERAEMHRSLRRLRLPVVLAVLGFAGWIGAILMDMAALRDQGLAYRQNAERILREVMIPTGPILDIRTQVTQVIDRARGAEAEAETEARPLGVLRQAGMVLRDHDLTVTQVSYQPGAGLVMDVQIADFAALDALVTALRAAGTEARVAQSVTREDSGVEAVLAMAVTQRGQR
ncbi:gspL periplasmic domain protein [Roseovarius sp. A-2]|uniref:type II secretion system protein GspL n=1 Tax=Roseovarius sp. A-2 TaxID=1570360 RepID=UPI0009B55467|nr:type II secretion system protein GspL [Roseovarius sp. A-2]GAW33312.1 gspL periplasmic domain protein [Roseovarius sp. A-2]